MTRCVYDMLTRVRVFCFFFLQFIFFSIHPSSFDLLVIEIQICFIYFYKVVSFLFNVCFIMKYDNINILKIVREYIFIILINNIFY